MVTFLLDKVDTNEARALVIRLISASETKSRRRSESQALFLTRVSVFCQAITANDKL